MLTIIGRASTGGTVGAGLSTYRGASLPTGMTATALQSTGDRTTLGTAFGGTVWDTSDLIINSSRYAAATTLTVSTTGSTGRTDLLNHLTTVAANDLDYKIIVPVATLSGGVYTLPAKTYPNRHCWIVNTDINGGSFGTARGTKIPASTTGMTILEGANASSSTIVEFADSANARGYSFHGCVIQNNQSSSANDISFGIIGCHRTSSQTAMSGYSGRLYIDRCWIRGSTTTDIRRGIAMNGPYLHIEDSRVTEIHYVGVESSGIGGWTGCQFHKHINCTIEAAAQAILYGGADPHNAQSGLLDPADIYSERIYAHKPLTWLPTHGTYAGTPWTVKVGFEAKNVRRWLIDRCWSQNCWVSGQSGGLMLFQNLSDQNLNDLQNRIDDVIVRNHRFDYGATVLSLVARVVYNGGTLPANPTNRFVFDNVYATRIGGTRAEADSIMQNGDSGAALGRAYLIFNDIQNLVWDRCTTDTKYGPYFVGDIGIGPGANWTVTNQVARLGQYGQTGNTIAQGCTSGLTNTGNVGYDLTELAPSTMGAGWDADETNSTMAFQDYANYDYRLTTGHLTKGVGGGVPGCDIDTLNTLLSGINT